MPRLASAISVGILLCWCTWSPASRADIFSAQIHRADLIDHGKHLNISAHIEYRLSPTAKEALHKGVPLTWIVLVEIREVGHLWDHTIFRQELPYRLQFHALLRQYEVLTPDRQSEMFLTLNAALSFLANLHDARPFPAEQLVVGRRYKLAVKCRFDRESLPVPLRPFTYLDTQWHLSSDWYICPIQR